MPDLYIITGSNGAGKSTIGPEYLPLEIKEKCFVFDGDKLFMQHKKHLGKRASVHTKKSEILPLNSSGNNLKI